ncbi:MAG: hypothetical protein LBR11_03465 [Deltaproteobacteria bacterium]|jgi:pentatricopeptide repeat protein|nr:hypothetical protein [Deltaproteobacteria bacterium]
MTKKNLDQKKNKKTLAKDLVRMIESYLAQGEGVEARALYESISKLGRSPTTDSQKAKAAHKLIHWYVDNNQTDSTLPLLQALARRSDNSEILMSQIDALGKIANSYVNSGQIERARELRLTIWSPISGESPQIRAETLKRIITDLCERNRHDEALKIHEVIHVDPVPPGLEGLMSDLAAELFRSLVASRRHAEAFVFFESLHQAWSKSQPLFQSLASSVSTLVMSLAFQGHFDQALKTYAFFQAPPDPTKGQTTFLEATAALLEALLLADRTQEALRIWLELPLETKREKYLDFMVVNAVLNLLRRLSQQGQAQKTLELYQDLDERRFNHLDYWSGGAQDQPQCLTLVVQAVVAAYWREPTKYRDQLAWVALKAHSLGENWDEEKLTLDKRVAYWAYKVTMVELLSPALLAAGLNQSRDELASDARTAPVISQLLGQAAAAVQEIERLPDSGLELAPRLARLEALRDLMTEPEREELWNELENQGAETWALVNEAASHLPQAIRALKLSGRAEAAQVFFNSVTWLNLRGSLGLYPAVLAAYQLETDETTATQADHPAEPLNEASAARYAKLLELVEMTCRQQKPEELEAGLANQDLESLAQTLTPAQAKTLARSLETVSQTWLVKSEVSTATLLVGLIPRLGQSPEIQLSYHLAVHRLLEKMTRHDQMAEVAMVLEQCWSFLAPDAEGPPKQWVSLALARSTEKLLHYNQGLPILWNDRILKSLSQPERGRSCLLAWAGLLAKSLDQYHVNPSLANSNEPKDYYQALTRLSPNGLSPREERFLTQVQADAHLSYLKYLIVKNQAEEAMSLYNQVEPQLVNQGGPRQKTVSFLAALIETLTKSQRLDEAQTWLQRTKIPELIQVDSDIRLRLGLNLISALCGQDNYSQARKLATWLTEDESNEQALTVQSVAYLSIILGLARQGQIEEALAVYMEMRKAEFAKTSYLYRLEALIQLLDVFIKSGETATAAHLFANRESLDPKPEDLETREWANFYAPRDLALEILPRLGLGYGTTRFSTGLVNSASSRLAEKGLELIRECLEFDEFERAIGIYRSLDTLPFVEAGPINLAAKTILDLLINSGREEEAKSLAKARAEKLTEAEAKLFISQFEPLFETKARRVKARLK